MNIFYLDKNFNLSAQYHVDKHIVKMPTEASQLLIDAIITTKTVVPPLTKSGKPFKPLSKGQHNHPCAKFSRTDYGFDFLTNYLKALCKEYTYRYNKIHFCESQYLKWIILNKPKFSIYQIDFPLAMPEYCRLKNPILSYRNYYNFEKQHLFSWKKRSVPLWIL